MAYPESTKKEVLALLKSGYPPGQLAKCYGVHPSTIFHWKKKAELDCNAKTIENIEKQLNRLTAIKQPTEGTTRKISMLSNTLARMTRTQAAQTREKRKPRVIRAETEESGRIRAAVPDALGLFPYQRRFYESEAQFRLVLKARQIGFSFVAGAEALVGAIEGRDQLFLSASEEQALILTRYVTRHAEKLGISLDGGDKEKRLPNGAVIKAMAHNWRTVQGFTGDIWMDEFAWYPNPKRIWAAFVPSIGTIKGRLTIMSTPFESGSLFHDLWRNHDKYFMFDRHRVDIHDAMRDGLDFDLETMRALFDSETWALCYECQFADDESSFYPIALIKSAVDYEGRYYIPRTDAMLYAGYDVGRIKDLSTLAALEAADEATLRLAVLDTYRRAGFDEQQTAMTGFMEGYPRARLRIDRTGIGMHLAENICKRFRIRAAGVHFTNVNKELMALNLKKTMEDGLLRIPNDSFLIADIHAIKRKIGQKSFVYDADRNEHGHADRFWALALAASHAPIQQIGSQPDGKAWII